MRFEWTSEYFLGAQYLFRYECYVLLYALIDVFHRLYHLYASYSEAGQPSWTSR